MEQKTFTPKLQKRRGIYFLVLFGLLFNWLAMPLGTSFLVEQVLAQEGLSALGSQFYCSTGSDTEDHTDGAHCKECQCCHQPLSVFVDSPEPPQLVQVEASPGFQFAALQALPLLFSVPLSRGPPSLV